MLNRELRFIKNTLIVLVISLTMATASLAVYQAASWVIDKQRENEVNIEMLYDVTENIVYKLKGLYIANSIIVSYLENKDIKPSYNYLTSVTVYIFNERQVKEDVIEGSVGTGVIVADKDGWFYILTNKHVCDNTDVGKCFVVVGEKRSDWVSLEYVSRIDSKKYDASLWRIENNRIGEKQAIKGISEASPSDKVYSVGHYLGNPFIYTEGTMGGYSIFDDSAIFNLPCAGGCSGSGVFNQNGELVGLVWGGSAVRTSLPFVVSYDTAKILAVNGDVLRMFLKELLD